MRHGRDCMVLADTTAGEATPFLVWLRDNHLLATDLIRFRSEAAVEQGIETDWRLPGARDAARVADELRHHAAAASRSSQQEAPGSWLRKARSQAVACDEGHRAGRP
ncbi:hypothetical protein EAO71_03455 [Streptomyces sp. ms191]|nr:hypothetical protein EAO71_03455 [Streptomyces sp. ms191]